MRLRGFGVAYDTSEWAVRLKARALTKVRPSSQVAFRKRSVRVIGMGLGLAPWRSVVRSRRGGQDGGRPSDEYGEAHSRREIAEVARELKTSRFAANGSGRCRCSWRGLLSGLGRIETGAGVNAASIGDQFDSNVARPTLNFAATAITRRSWRLQHVGNENSQTVRSEEPPATKRDPLPALLGRVRHGAS